MGRYMKKYINRVVAIAMLIIMLFSFTSVTNKVNADPSKEPTAIVYSNGDMVLQLGNTKDSSKGVVLAEYTDFINENYTYVYTPPWISGKYKKTIKKVIVKDEIYPVSTTAYFYGMTALEKIENIEKIKMDKVKDLSYMFYQTYNLKSLDLSAWNTKNVTSIFSMFNYSGIEELNISSWDTSNLSSMYNSFANTQLEELNLSHFNTSKVGDLKYVFFGSSSLKRVDLSNWNLSKVTSMDSLFRGCSALEEVKMDNWYSNTCEDIDYMFRECSSLKVADLSWLHSNSVSYYQAFSLSNVNKIILPAESVADMSTAMFIPTAQWKQESTGEILTSDELVASHVANKKQDTYYRLMDVTFYSEYASKKEVKQVLVASPYKEGDVNVPQKVGYDFIGWYNQRVGGEPLVEGTSLYNQDTYYAHWKAKKYKLILDSNNSSGEKKEIELAYDEGFNLSDDIFTLNGKKVQYWNTSNDGRGTSFEAKEFIRGLTDEGTITLYAIFEDDPRYVTVAFDPKNGDPVTYQKVLKGSVISEIGAYSMPPNKDGFYFEDWLKGATKVSRYFVINTDVIFEAKYHKLPIMTVKYNIPGKADDTIQLAYKEYYYTKIPSVSGIDNNNKVFIGWFLNKGCTIEASRGNSTNEDITVYAKWVYKPIFNLAGGHFTSPALVDNGQESIYTFKELPTAKKEGYEFVSWDYDLTGKPVKVGDTVDLSKGKEFTAKWREVGKVQLSLEVGNDTLSNARIPKGPIIFSKGEAIKGLVEATNKNANLRFDGWKDANGQVYNNGDIINEDLVLYANYVPKDICNITFIAGLGSTDTVSMNAEKGFPLDYIPGATRPNYIFKGWYTKPDGQGERLNKDFIINYSATFYAYYEPSTSSYSGSEGDIDFIAEWKNASNSQIHNEDNRLIFDVKDNNSVSAQLHLRLLCKDLSKVIPVGAAKIRIPKSVWKNWEGEETGSCDISNFIPKWPDKRADLLFSYQETADEYILVNNVELASGAGIDATISYSVMPIDVPGGAVDDIKGRLEEYPYFSTEVSPKFEIDANGDGQDEITCSNDLFLEMKTALVAKVIYQPYVPNGADIVMEWNDYWGYKPEDADQYFYLRWDTSLNIQSLSQKANLYVEDRDDIVMVRNSINEKKELTKTTAWYETMIIRYPKTLLNNIPETGRDLTETVQINLEWQSGYVEHIFLVGTKTIYPKDIPIGNFTKSNSYGADDKVVENKDAQNVLLVDKNELLLSWQFRYNGQPYTEEPLWDDVNKTYTAKESVIEITDGNPGDQTYNTGADSDKYSWNPKAGTVELEDNDYYFSSIMINTNTSYDAVKEGDKWTGLIKNNDFDPVDIYIRYANTSEYVFYKTHTSLDHNRSKIIGLPNNVAGFKVLIKTSAFSKDIFLTAYESLKPSKRLTSLIKEDKEKDLHSIIKNSASCDIYEADDNSKTSFFHVNMKESGVLSKQCTYDLGAVGHKQSLGMVSGTQDNIIIDALNGKQDNLVYFYANNRSLDNQYVSRALPIKSGVFYNLLPAGTSVQEDSIVFQSRYATTSFENLNFEDRYKSDYNMNEKANYTVSFQENWQGSGRTMMIIRFNSPNNNSVVGVWYKLTNSFDNILAKGTTVQTDLAFVDESQDVSLPTIYTSSTADITVKDYYDSIDKGAGGQLAYSFTPVPYKEISAYSWGFNKYVKGNSNAYNNEDLVKVGEGYTYKLSYIQSQEKTSGKLVFLDILEGGVDGNSDKKSDWHGAFTSIDTSYMETLESSQSNKKCKPIVYYSTVDRDTLKESSLYTSLVNSGGSNAPYLLAGDSNWTTVMPADKSAITAVAVDCSKSEDGSTFILQSNKVAFVEVKMKAPDDVNAYNTVTYNEAFCSADMGAKYFPAGVTDTSSPDYQFMKADTALTLKNVDPVIHKDANPARGTVQEPTKVNINSDLIYKVSLTNNDAQLSIDNIDVQDLVPVDLRVLTEDIKVTFGAESDAIKLSESQRVSLVQNPNNANDLKLNIVSLKAKETVLFLIPTVTPNKEMVISNKATVTSVNGNERSIESETTYHRTKEMRDIVVKKTVSGDGADTSKAFNFRISLAGDELPTNISYKVMENGSLVTKTMELVNGTYSFKLKNNESITFKDIPTGTNYELTELDGESQGYKVTTINDKGTLDSYDPSKNPVGVIDRSLLISVNNHKDNPVSLPNTWSFEGAYLLLAMVAMGTVALALKAKGRSKNGEN